MIILISPIDSKRYNEGHLKRYNDIYKEADKIYIPIFGNNYEEVLDNIPKDTKFIEKIYKDEEYSYSKAINRILKELKNEDIVIVSDTWNIFSMYQLNQDIKNTSFKEEFIIIDCLLEDTSIGKPINYDSKKLMSIVSNKLYHLKDKIFTTPIVVFRNEYIKDIIGNIDESKTDETCRLELIERLDYLGLEQRKCSKEGLTTALINSKIKEEKKEQYEETDDSTELEEIIKLSKEIEKSTNVAGTSKILKNINSDKKGLVLIHNSVFTVATTTDLLSKLYESKYQIDIITNNKNGPSLNLIHQYLYNNIYDVDDISADIINYKKYDFIIRTNNCNIKLPKTANNIDLYNPNHDIDNPTISNSSTLSNLGIEYESELPLCNYLYPEQPEYQGYIVVNIGIKKNSALRWKYFDNLISRISKHMDHINILIISEKGEEITQNVKKLKMYKNTIFNLNLSPLEISGLLKDAYVTITSRFSDVAWIGYATQNKTYLIEGHEDKIIPKVPWINGTKNTNIVIDSDISVKNLKNNLDKIIDEMVFENIKGYVNE